MRPNGNCFIGQRLAKKLKGFIYKFSVIKELLKNKTLTGNVTTNGESLKSNGPVMRNYKDDSYLNGFGFEISLRQGSVYKGPFKNGRLTRMQRRTRTTTSFSRQICQRNLA